MDCLIESIIDTEDIIVVLFHFEVFLNYLKLLIKLNQLVIY